MSHSWARIDLLRLVLLFGAVHRAPGDCPTACECKWKNGKESVLCLNANLSTLPPGVDAGTQVLDLTGNQLSELRRDAFSAAGLLNLQKIYVAKCRIKTLDRYAFRKLKNLVELDLSYNVLSAIPSHVLDSVSELRELKLSGNPIQRLLNDAFVNVPQLVRLELSDCRLGSIEARAFAGLERSLELLKLNNNRLIDVRSSTLTSLHSLHGLELAGNPWNCSCGLRPLREWMLRQNIPYGLPPTCRQPPRLFTRSWDRLSLDDFACPPRIWALAARVDTSEGGNVSLSCRVQGSPEPTVRWLYRSRVIANISSGISSANKKLYVVHRTEGGAHLTIMMVEAQDTGVYTCTAENRAGRVASNVSLGVERPHHQQHSASGKVLVAGVVVALLSVTALSLVTMCVCSLHQKQSARRRGLRRAESYEKIELEHKTSNGYAAETLSDGPIRQRGQYQIVPFSEGCDRRDGTLRAETILGQRTNSAVPTESDGEQRFYSDLPVTQHLMRKEVLPSGSLFTSAIHDDRNFPDLLDTSPFSSTTDNSNAQYFSTLPRTRNQSNVNYPQVSDSQSPLLTGSQFGSSGGDSVSSSRHLSESRASSYYRLSGGWEHRSSSWLNLNSSRTISRGHHRTNPSLPTSPCRSSGPTTETPILNILGVGGLSPSQAASTYDYHAAQLERFLEEYRSLQHELSKMKETCESLTTGASTDMAPEVTRLLEPLLTPGSDEGANPKSILKNKGAPDTNNPYWLPRSTLYSKNEYYQSC